MAHILRSIRSACKRHGLAKSFSLIALNAIYFSKRALRLSAADALELDEFDRVHGTETSHIREVGSLGIESVNARYAVRYEPSDADIFKNLLGRIDADLSSFSFVDFGCGKGRALLLASNHPFRKIVGIEFSRELADIAKRNISLYHGAEQSCRSITVVTCDATEYEVPDEALVCYFYNPFGAEVLRKVVGNLIDSLQRCEREIFLVYLNPRHRSVIDQCACWQPLSETPSCVIYRIGRYQHARSP